MKPTRSQIRAQLKKLNTLTCKESTERRKFDRMCELYYGEETYSDHDEDWIIDHLDYGQGMISFEDFDQIMRRINTKQKDE